MLAKDAIIAFNKVAHGGPSWGPYAVSLYEYMGVKALRLLSGKKIVFSAVYEEDEKAPISALVGGQSVDIEGAVAFINGATKSS